MDAPYYNGEPGALPSDREWDAKPAPEPETPTCVDCGDVVVWGGRSLAPLGMLCRPCADAREAIGAEFDARPIRVIRHGAA